jgi:hypothetical protein
MLKPGVNVNNIKKVFLKQDMNCICTTRSAGYYVLGQQLLYSKNYTKSILFGQRVQFLNIEAGGTCGKHLCLKELVEINA